LSKRKFSQGVGIQAEPWGTINDLLGEEEKEKQDHRQMKTAEAKWRRLWEE
jgi:hypothetical protein